MESGYIEIMGDGIVVYVCTLQCIYDEVYGIKMLNEIVSYLKHIWY